MSRALAACAALLAVLVFAPAASAKDGLWDGVKGVQRLHFKTRPILVKPGQNSIDNVVVPPAQKPKVDGYIVRARPDLTYLDGKVPPVDVIHLHHGVWLNASGSSPASPVMNIQPIFFGGEEKTVFRIPRGYGYAYKKKDTWILNEMIHNNTPNATKVRLVWDLEFIPARSALAKTVKPVIPFWMDVRRGWGYPVFDVAQNSGGADGQFTFPDEAAQDPYAGGPRQDSFTMPYDGDIVAAVGHLHPGGLRDDIFVRRPGAGPEKLVFRSQAKYYDPAGPVSWDVSLTASRPSWRVGVKAGDVLRIASTYDTRKAAWYENMGIVLLFVAPNERTGPDPFATTVDPNGVLTHGHLAENNNHGGKGAVYPDARKVASGPAVRTVEIKDFQFRPGDLGLLLGGGKVPVVPQGQSLTFVNKDDTSIEWHSITTCRVPCNKSTGISYPLADGGPATQFDSGQLGFGPKGFSPAANTVEFRTPSNLPPGTYTYFCRIHPFMRGAFRVQ